MLNSKKIIPLLLVGAFVLLLLAGYFLWWPKEQEFGNKKKELEAKHKEIKGKKDYLSELNSFSEKLSQYQAEISKINDALPSEPSAAALFNYIEKASSENGLILESIDVSQLYASQEQKVESSEEKIQKMPFSVSLTGSYSSFKNFLSALYLNSRMINVRSISFSSPAEEDKLFNFNLELEAQYFKP
jgi:type IV pilus assembly protein PilO